MTTLAEGPRDPVCGMLVDPDGPHHHEHAGTRFHFCCEKCANRFRDDPARFLGDAKPAPVPSGSLFTCPMHPEVEQDVAGDCPDCGMALEPTLAIAATRWTNSPS